MSRVRSQPNVSSENFPDRLLCKAGEGEDLKFKVEFWGEGGWLGPAAPPPHRLCLKKRGAGKRIYWYTSLICGACPKIV